MKRLTAFIAAGLVAVSVSTGGAATSKPFVGSWKAKLTVEQLLDYGIVQPKLRGTWKLELKADGTYRMYNPWDRWTTGRYSADATRIVVSKDTGCLKGGLKGPGVYRWKLLTGKLKLASVKVDPCGGRWQILTIPLWQRA
jgi:hypothetical protein